MTNMMICVQSHERQFLIRLARSAGDSTTNNVLEVMTNLATADRAAVDDRERSSTMKVSLMGKRTVSGYRFSAGMLYPRPGKSACAVLGQP